MPPRGNFAVDCTKGVPIWLLQGPGFLRLLFSPTDSMPKIFSLYTSQFQDAYQTIESAQFFELVLKDNSTLLTQHFNVFLHKVTFRKHIQSSVQFQCTICILAFSVRVFHILGSTRLICFYYINKIQVFSDHLNLTI